MLKMEVRSQTLVVGWFIHLAGWRVKVRASRTPGKCPTISPARGQLKADRTRLTVQGFNARLVSLPVQQAVAVPSVMPTNPQGSSFPLLWS